MKTIILSAIVICLMIGAPLAYANQADTEKEAGIARDAQGRICDFGLHHDECPNTSNTMPPGSKADDGEDVSGFTILPPGQHYAGCEEDIHHELGCDVVNDTALQKPYWSRTPVDNPGFKQVHVIILNDVPNFGAGKTKIILSLGGDHSIDLTSHIIDIPKPTEKNSTLDAGYFIVPTSLVKSDALEVGINILGADGPDSGGTVFHGLNDTVFSVDDYYQTT